MLETFTILNVIGVMRFFNHFPDHSTGSGSILVTSQTWHIACMNTSHRTCNIQHWSTRLRIHAPNSSHPWTACIEEPPQFDVKCNWTPVCRVRLVLVRERFAANVGSWRTYAQRMGALHLPIYQFPNPTELARLITEDKRTLRVFQRTHRLSRMPILQISTGICKTL